MTRYHWERGKGRGFSSMFAYHTAADILLQRTSEEKFRCLKDSLAKKYMLPLDSVYYSYYKLDDGRLLANWRLNDRDISLSYNNDSSVYLDIYYRKKRR
jgi:hypothetical protein